MNDENPMPENLLDEFTPEGIEYVQGRIRAFRQNLLCADTECAAPLALPHWMLALSLLDQAATNLELAQLHQVQAIGARRLGR